MRFNLKLTFDSIYRHRYFLSVVLFWNYLPFLVYLLLLAGNVLAGGDPILQNLITLTAFAITVLYQLYLWSYAFFAAQDASLGNIRIPDYNLGEMFTDWGVKFRLLLIRVGYYLPLFIIILILTELADPLALTQLIAGRADPDTIITLGTYIVGVASTSWLYTSVIESIVLVAANFQYSYTGKAWSAFNVVKVLKFMSYNWQSLIVLFFLQLGFGIVSIGILTLFSFVLVIPFVGIIVFSIFSGFATSWQVVFIPNLMGQIWQASEQRFFPED